MPLLGPTIMPKETKTPMQYLQTQIASVPYSSSASTGQRSAAIWTTSDDEILLQARASGLNWQPIASRHFPNKTANACRKRHERLIERRHVEDWDSRKLDLLAQEYLAVRQEMWEMLAERVGERWQVVEAKCMEKGLKTLQATTRMAARKASVSQSHYSNPSRGITPQNSDSGIGTSSDAEMEAVETLGHFKSASWDSQLPNNAGPLAQGSAQSAEHLRARSLPQPLPLYQPPAPLVSSTAMPAQSSHRHHENMDMRVLPGEVRYSAHRPPMPRAQAVHQPYSSSRTSVRGSAGISIQSVLAPASAETRARFLKHVEHPVDILTIIGRLRCSQLKAQQVYSRGSRVCCSSLCSGSFRQGVDVILPGPLVGTPRKAMPEFSIEGYHVLIDNSWDAAALLWMRADVVLGLARDVFRDRDENTHCIGGSRQYSPKALACMLALSREAPPCVKYFDESLPMVMQTSRHSIADRCSNCSSWVGSLAEMLASGPSYTVSY
nr:hypothetical protein CFP56_58833 [Quercus suber]